MHTLHDLFTAYQADGIDHAPNTCNQRAAFHRRALRDFGNVVLEQLTPDLLRAWKLALVHEQHLAPSTVHKYLGLFSAALRYGVECGWLASNPAAGIRKPSPGEGRVRFLTGDERTRLLAACKESRNPLLYAVVVVALGTGGRKNEVRCLRWDAVDLGAQVVRFLHTKTHRARALPLAGDALTVLQHLAARRYPEVSLVFPTWHGLAPVGLESQWQWAKRRAALEDFHFHDLRHTFASYMAMSGATLRDIADALGHQNIQQTLRYAHLLPSHTRAVVERMTQQFLG